MIFPLREGLRNLISMTNTMPLLELAKDLVCSLLKRMCYMTLDQSRALSKEPLPWQSTLRACRAGYIGDNVKQAAGARLYAESR